LNGFSGEASWVIVDHSIWKEFRLRKNRSPAAKQAAEKGVVLQKREEERTGPKGLKSPDFYGTAEAVPFVQRRFPRFEGRRPRAKKRIHCIVMYGLKAVPFRE
jgi:hypothetical protein